jgi:hypothetical protein
MSQIPDDDNDTVSGTRALELDRQMLITPCASTINDSGESVAKSNHNHARQQASGSGV